MKKILVLSVFLLIGLPVFSIEATSQEKRSSLLDGYGPSVDHTETALSLLLYDCYEFDRERIAYKFRPFSKDEEKKLSEDEKKFYRDIRKVQKLLDKNKPTSVLNALKIVQSCDEMRAKVLAVPVTVYSMDYFFQKGDYNRVLSGVLVLREINKGGLYFDKEAVDYKVAVAYWITGYYSKAITEFMKIAQYYKVDYMIADCYFQQKNYNNAIKYALRVSKADSYYADANEVLFLSYLEQGKKAEANKYANILVKLQPNYTNYIRAGVTSGDKKTQLQNYRKALPYAKDTEEQIRIYAYIAVVEQEKIDSAHKTISSFVTKPDWDKTFNELPAISLQYVIKRQDEFFAATNNCIARYSGDNLAKCFEAVNKEQALLTSQVKEELYRQQQLNLAIQQNIELQRANYLRTIQNLNQIQSNNLQQQRNLQLQNTNTQLQNINNNIQGIRYGY